MNHRLPWHADPDPASPAPQNGLAAVAGGVSTLPLELVFRRRDDWQDGLGRLVLPLDCSVAEPQSFQCSAVVRRLRGNTLAELRVDASRLTRRASHIDAGDADVVKVVWLLAGRSRTQQGPNSATLDVGHWTVLDPAREYALELDKGSRILLLLVPRAECPSWLPALNVLAGRALPGGGPAHIAMASLAAMLRDVVPLDVKSEATLHDSIIALIERALSIELGALGLEAQPERSIQLPQVQNYVLEHLADTRLNVATVAAVFGVSRRNVYNIFRASGSTPHAFIQRARLDRACTLLNEPEGRRLSVASVARQCGFSDPAHFSRAFRARHGVAPTTWRGNSR